MNRALLVLTSFLIPLLADYPFLTVESLAHYSDHVIMDHTTLPSPKKVKKGDVVFVNTLYLDLFLKTIEPRIKNPFILITHKNCRSITEKHLKSINNPKIIRWFAKNAEVEHPKLIPLPIGFCYKNNAYSALLNALIAPPNEKKHLLHMSHFNKGVAVKVRKAVQGKFSQIPYCYASKRKPFSDYINDLKRSQFVLSPRGKGWECYRTWEAMLMGAIPIFTRSPVDKVYDDLPVLILESWDEINKSFLKEKYKEMKSKSYRLEKLYADYHLNKILALRAKVKGKPFTPFPRKNPYLQFARLSSFKDLDETAPSEDLLLELKEKQPKKVLLLGNGLHPSAIQIAKALPKKAELFVIRETESDDFYQWISNILHLKLAHKIRPFSDRSQIIEAFDMILTASR